VDPVIERMQALIRKWEAEADQKSVFLSCYLMMTENMLTAIEQDEFIDTDWVVRLLHHFAEYYFHALESYEQDPSTTPLVWKLAYSDTGHITITPLQKLLLGVNAHINYDLVFTLVDLLKPEWETLSEDQRVLRYTDHCHVNQVIGQTIDSVQDLVIEPAMPIMDLVDKLLGPIDEMLISHLITHWRETVWKNAIHLLETEDAEEQTRLISHIGKEALQIGEFISPGSVIVN
jgi:hypothetical protein